MTVFVDSSALLGVLNRRDTFHQSASAEWRRLLDNGARLVSTNYVILECTALAQNRIGLDAVRLLQTDVQPVIDLLWIDRDTHGRASEQLVAANRRSLSLVDLTSFTTMREHRIDNVFTFDRHFAEQGFRVLPSS